MNRRDDLPAGSRVVLQDESDVAMARKHTREVGRSAGLRAIAVESLIIAVSEVARNVVVHGGGGELVLRVGHENRRTSVIAAVRDQGPGIADVGQAMQDGFSTAGSLGMGLPSARRLVDQFDIASAIGMGTTVTLTMWVV